MKTTAFVCDRCGAAGNSQTSERALFTPHPDQWRAIGFGNLKELDLCPRCALEYRAVLKHFLAERGSQRFLGEDAA